MAQLISLYNHPLYRAKKLSKKEFDLLEEIWHNEDKTNQANGEEIYDVQSLEAYINDNEEAM